MFLGYSEYSRFLQVILAQVQIPCPNLDSKVHKSTVNKRIFLSSPNNQKWLQHYLEVTSKKRWVHDRLLDGRITAIYQGRQSGLAHVPGAAWAHVLDAKVVK